MYTFLRTLLFLFNAEKAHSLTMGTMNLLCSLPLGKVILRGFFRTKDHPVVIDGITFPNRVGLAAGFDKNAKYLKEWYHLGFGHVEIGTVTPKPQEGNPKPRLFRLPEDHALINRMGFNNDGLEVIKHRLSKRQPGLIVGGNIGKNKSTPNEQAKDDYVKCFEALFPVVDYFTVNVSSPNTPGLRELQDKGPLTELLSAIMKLNKEKNIPKPVYLKIAPDMGEEQIKDIVDIVLSCGIHGIIACNTTIERTSLNTPKHTLDQIGSGGLSGRPIKRKSDAMIFLLRKHLGPDKTIIGVGGIETPSDAADKINAGANLVQVYSGYIYSGPSLVKRIIEKIH